MDPCNNDAASSQNPRDHKEDTKCPVCLEEFNQAKPPETLSKCKHRFCAECLEAAMSHKPMCPVCKQFYGEMEGNQPKGTMTVTESRFPSVPGYEGCGTITVNYSFPSGIQGVSHFCFLSRGFRESNVVVVLVMDF